MSLLLSRSQSTLSVIMARAYAHYKTRHRLMAERQGRKASGRPARASQNEARRTDNYYI